ncbi:MATE family efflux transporter, partial [Ruminococcus sp.]
MEKELKKQKLDMLNGSIWNKLPVFALPIAATGILEQLFNASDIAIVGNFAQTDKTAAVAAVGANSPIIGLILNLFIGIALGANVVIANAIGRDDRQTVQKAVHTSMVVSVIGGVLVAIIGELIAEPLLTVLNVPDDVLELALLYLRIYFLGMPVILLYNFEAAIFRSIGETKMPLIALTLSGILNVLLNLFFVIVLKMSVNGVATATVLANVVSAGILYIKLVKSDKYIKVEFKKLRIDGKVFAKIMQIGLPAGIQSAVFAVANIVIQGAINSLGTTVIAASSAAFNIEIIAYNVMNSFSQACTTFVGQNFGANKIDRCKKTLFLCLIEDAIASGTAIFIVLITGKFLLSIFNNNPEVIEIGYTRLVIIFIAYIFSMLYE